MTEPSVETPEGRAEIREWLPAHETAEGTAGGYLYQALAALDSRDATIAALRPPPGDPNPHRRATADRGPRRAMMRKEVSIEQLDDGKVVSGLEPGDMILHRNGAPAANLHAIQYGYIFDLGNGQAGVFYAPLGDIKTIILPIDAITQAAEWLLTRRPTAPDQERDDDRAKRCDGRGAG
jgi:hypothetical protein